VKATSLAKMIADQAAASCSHDQFQGVPKRAEIHQKFGRHFCASPFTKHYKCLTETLRLGHFSSEIVRGAEWVSG
jgi:hypothetical protein